MGACHTKRSRRQSNEWRVSERLTSDRLDFIFQRLSLYLELVGDTHSLGGYLQEKINELFEIKQKHILVKDHLSKLELLHQASEVIEYLYDDKHFSQAFPILRESLYSEFYKFKINKKSVDFKPKYTYKKSHFTKLKIYFQISIRNHTLDISHRVIYTKRFSK